jgi:hypothetical protein
MDTNQQEALMSRIATVTTVLTMLVAPAAFAAPADYHANGVDPAQHAQPTRFYLGSVLVTRAAHPVTTPATPTKYYLGSELVKRSPNGTITAATPQDRSTKFGVGPQIAPSPANVDLRSPDAKDVFVTAGHNQSPNAVPQSSDNDVDWGTIGIIMAALAACGALALVLRRRPGVDRPLGV